MRKMPLIGITGYHVTGEEGVGGTFRGVKGQGFSVIGHDYIQAVKQVGAIPIGIPVGDHSTCNEILQAIDGLILAGGEDIDPQLYGSSPDLRCWTITPERDRFELQLIEEALRVHKPILAICRGMQLLNVSFGGTLYLDISDHAENVLAHQFSRAPRWYLAHRVKLLAPSIKKLFQADEIRTNSPLKIYVLVLLSDDKNIVRIKSAFIAGLLIYRIKFLSICNVKNLIRLPIGDKNIVRFPRSQRFENHVFFFNNILVKNNKVYLAIEASGEQVVGILACNENWVNQLYVHTQYQGRGIGNRLLNK